MKGGRASQKRVQGTDMPSPSIMGSISMQVCVYSVVSNSATPCAVPHQALLCLEVSRQKYCSE